MTTTVNIPNAANSTHKLNVAQSSNPNQVTFIEPGASLSVSLHSGNTVTIAEGAEVSSGPGIPSGRLTG